MKKMIAAIGVSLSLFCATAADTATPVRETLVHSHNDYSQKRPFWGAYDAGADTIEADIHLVDGELIVAHGRREVAPTNTLRRLYLEPIRTLFKQNGGKIRADGRPVRLMIDLKSGKPALDKLLELIEKEGYRECFDSKHNPSAAILVACGGPDCGNLLDYSDYVVFALDAAYAQKIPAEWFKKVEHICRNGRAYTKWRKGEMSEEDKAKIREAAKFAHDRGAKFRLWNFPDNPEAWKIIQELGVDYLNTDHPAKAVEFLRGKKK